jgi:hypothetical protein
MTCLSREHEFLQRTNAVMASGLPAVREAAGPKAHQLTKSLLEACQLVITSDLYFREAERIEVLGLDPGRARIARRRAKFRNDACLEILEQEVRPAIAEVRKKFGTEQNIKCKRAFDFFELECREALAGIDISQRQTAIAGRLLTRTRAVADEAGIDGLCAALDRRCKRLIKLRKERDEHNNPVLAIIGVVIVATGFLLFGICSALSPGRVCRNGTIQFLSGVLILFGLSVLLVAGGSGETENGGGAGGDGGGFPEGPPGQL